MAGFQNWWFLCFCFLWGLGSSVCFGSRDVDSAGGRPFDRHEFARAVASRLSAARSESGGRNGALAGPADDRLLMLDVQSSTRAKPKDTFSSITPVCQRMQNYYFSTCVYAPPMLRANDPGLAPLGER